MDSKHDGVIEVLQDGFTEKDLASEAEVISRLSTFDIFLFVRCAVVGFGNMVVG